MYYVGLLGHVYVGLLGPVCGLSVSSAYICLSVGPTAVCLSSRLSVGLCLFRPSLTLSLPLSINLLNRKNCST